MRHNWVGKWVLVEVRSCVISEQTCHYKIEADEALSSLGFLHHQAASISAFPQLANHFTKTAAKCRQAVLQDACPIMAPLVTSNQLCHNAVMHVY
jgi:hypothetical protein